MMRPRLLLGWVGLIALQSCGGSTAPPTNTSNETIRFEVPPGLLQDGNHRDLIVVAIDTLRADRLPFYGSFRATGGNPEQTWSLSWLARHGTLFEHMWAPAGMTMPSFSSLWTGMVPAEHGAMNNLTRLAAPTFAMELARRGWRGHSSVSNFILRKGSGLQRGFATTAVHRKAEEAAGPADLVQRAAEDIAKGQRLFLWGHFMAPHQPYAPAPQHRGRFSSPAGVDASKEILFAIHRNPSSLDAATHEQLKALYDEEILTANDYVMELLSGLDAAYRQAGRGALLDNAVVVFLSDHGEELGDRNGYFMHAKSLYSGVTHPPLILLGAGWQPGRRESADIALQDVLPMVLFGKLPQRKYFVSAYNLQYYSIRDARWTLVHNPADNARGPLEPPKDAVYSYPVVALFDRQQDPLELHDVSKQYPEETKRMLDALHQWYQNLKPPFGTEKNPMSSQELETIGAIGYATDVTEENPWAPWRGSQWKP